VVVLRPRISARPGLMLDRATTAVLLLDDDCNTLTATGRLRIIVLISYERAARTISDLCSYATERNGPPIGGKAVFWAEIVREVEPARRPRTPW